MLTSLVFEPESVTHSTLMQKNDIQSVTPLQSAPKSPRNPHSNDLNQKSRLQSAQQAIQTDSYFHEFEKSKLLHALSHCNPIVTQCNQDQYNSLNQAEERLRIQIKYIENAKKQIHANTHPDVLGRFTAMQEQEQKMNFQAKCKQQYLQHCATLLFMYECEQANEEFESRCENLRQSMLNEIENEMEFLTAQRKGTRDFCRSLRKVNARKTRSSRSKKEDGSSVCGTATSIFSNTSSTTSNGNLEKAGKNCPGKKSNGNQTILEKTLSSSEVNHDLQELYSSLNAIESKSSGDDGQEQDLILAKYHRGKLLYHEVILDENDEIVVWDTLRPSAHFGIVQSITASEISVLSERGGIQFISLSDLRTAAFRLEIVTNANRNQLMAQVSGFHASRGKSSFRSDPSYAHSWQDSRRREHMVAT
ncbi:unnamed protein product [Albugo candida]|uniref:Uncharacterized protein n=2 Tax=Albugo candida TaxID=65357 RepID=A0A024GPY0_9STRA|nr:unnamed protein product [Albugo candida]|eukprot:CCI48616.1 unnamed protein product [Albugo candida]